VFSAVRSAPGFFAFLCCDFDIAATLKIAPPSRTSDTAYAMERTPLILNAAPAPLHIASFLLGLLTPCAI
jgi:hypothetical protein